MELVGLETTGLRVNANLIVPVRFDHENQVIVTVAIGLPLAYARPIRFDPRRTPDTRYDDSWVYQPGLASLLASPHTAMLAAGARDRHREDRWAMRHPDRIAAIAEQLTRVCDESPGLVLDAQLRYTATRMGTNRVPGENHPHDQLREPSYPMGGCHLAAPVAASAADAPAAGAPVVDTRVSSTVAARTRDAVGVIGADTVMAHAAMARATAGTPTAASARDVDVHTGHTGQTEYTEHTVARRALAVLGADEVYRRLLAAQV